MSQTSAFSSMTRQTYALPNRKRANTAGGSNARSVRSRSAPSGIRKSRPPLRRSTASLKSLVRSIIQQDTEHKFTDDVENNWLVGQVNDDGSGHHKFDIALPIQGVGSTTRIGERIKAIKLDLNFTYMTQGAGGSQNDVNLTHFVVGYFGVDPQSNIADFLNRNECIFSANAGELIYDRMSMRNQDYLQSVKVLGSFKTLISKRSTIFGASDQKFQNKMDQFSVPINKHIEFSDTGTTPANLNIAVITVADYGNIGSSITTLLGVPQTAVSTGVRVFCSYRFTFTDV